MNPDVAAAIQRLVRDGVLTTAQAGPLLRVAEGHLVSVYRELRLVLYGGVLLLTAGVGALVMEQLDRLGPLTITAALSVSVGLCFAWVRRKAPPFSWQLAPPTDIAFDYVLLLGVLLASADVAYIEAQFTPLGSQWPWHLLWASLFMAWASFRYDSRIVFSLALANFASWRGVSVSLLERGFWWNFADSMRFNTVSCGLFFAWVGFALRRSGKKKHFEPVATYLGWSLVLTSLASGAFSDTAFSSAYAIVLLLVGSALAARSFLSRRFALFAMGVSSAYLGLSHAVISAMDSYEAIFGWFFISSGLLVAALSRTRRAMVKSS